MEKGIMFRSYTKAIVKTLGDYGKDIHISAQQVGLMHGKGAKT